MIKQKDLKDQLLQEKIIQLEQQNLELKKSAESLITDFIELDETAEAMKKEIGILKGKLSQQHNRDVDDGGHTGGFRSYSEYYRYYGSVEDRRNILSHNNLHLQQQQNGTNWESRQRTESYDHIEIDDNRNVE